jgi:hypothetical protein
MNDKQLAGCRRIEEYLIENHSRWEKSTTLADKESYYKFGIRDQVWQISLKKNQFSRRISKRLLNELYVNPSVTMSQDHDILRTDLSKIWLKNFKQYNFIGNGNIIEKEIDNLTFSYVSRTENIPNYNRENIEWVEISDKMIDWIKRYNRLAKTKNWFQKRKITVYEDFLRLSKINTTFKNEDEFWRSLD